MEKNKVCTYCKTERPVSLFSAHSKANDGLQSNCKSCCAERARKTRIGRPCITCGKKKEEGVPKGAKLCIECAKVCYRCKSSPRVKQHRMCSKCMADHDKERKSGPDTKFKERITRIASNFKVRRPLAAVLAAIQHCAACGKKSVRPGEMHVDHCHVTGDVRGVLCFNCNAALGHINDSIPRLEALISYLKSVQSNISGISDLEKAKHFIDLLIELESKA